MIIIFLDKARGQALVVMNLFISTLVGEHIFFNPPITIFVPSKFGTKYGLKLDGIGRDDRFRCSVELMSRLSNQLRVELQGAPVGHLHVWDVSA